MFLDYVFKISIGDPENVGNKFKYFWKYQPTCL